MNLRNRLYSLVGKVLAKSGKRIKKYKQRQTAGREESGIIKQGITLLFPAYRKYLFCDKATGEGYFFRYKPIKEEGKYPLIIYHHGNGWNRFGKNTVQLVEFSCLMKKLNKRKCHQAAIHLDYSCEYNRAGHSKALDGLVEYINNTYKNVDFSRIYLAGTSYGGYACVYEVLRCPEKYAAAVISMAYTHNENYEPEEEIRENSYVRSLTAEDYKSLAGTPFYLSWARDDHPIMTGSNELLLKNLKENGGDIKAEIYNDGGHTIASGFYRGSNWDEWLFSKVR